MEPIDFDGLVEQHREAIQDAFDEDAAPPLAEVVSLEEFERRLDIAVARREQELASWQPALTTA